MIEVKHLLRKAYIDFLDPIAYLGSRIPIGDENLTEAPAKLAIGNSTGVEAYILIQNQTLQDASAKCGVNQDTQLQIHIFTIFPAGVGANSGNYSHADLIGNIVLQKLFPGNTDQAQIPFTEAQLWRAWLEGSRHIMESWQGKRAYRNVYIMNHSINQNIVNPT